MGFSDRVQPHDTELQHGRMAMPAPNKGGLYPLHEGPV